MQTPSWLQEHTSANYQQVKKKKHLFGKTNPIKTQSQYTYNTRNSQIVYGIYGIKIQS